MPQPCRGVRKALKRPAHETHVPRAPRDHALAKILAFVMGVQSLVPMAGPARQGKIVVGSACSGYNSDLLALEMLKVDFVSAFACELDPKIRALSALMHAHFRVFEDCCTNTFLQSPNCDLFMSGFPCQPYSKAGKNQGVADDLGRGLVIFWLLKWLWLHKPKAFVLENVGNFAQQHKDILQIILQVRVSFKIYEVEWKILENSTVGYIPQHRERVFICGILKSSLKCPFRWPEPVDKLPLTTFFKKNTQNEAQLGYNSLNKTEASNVRTITAKILNKGHDPKKHHYVCDISGTVPHMMLEVSPCLTETRAASCGHWLSWLERKMSTSECLALQGVSMTRMGDYSQFLSDRQLRRMAGNSVPVPMLARVLDMMLVSSGLK